mmetsp:Transcript_47718/g.113383  ORF Transcript_47718/g.113383 Transcript_47718/m.113383 type:complete len:239 (+) Transcript_47718:705-1421(+)
MRHPCLPRVSCHHGHHLGNAGHQLGCRTCHHGHHTVHSLHSSRTDHRETAYRTPCRKGPTAYHTCHMKTCRRSSCRRKTCHTTCRRTCLHNPCRKKSSRHSSMMTCCILSRPRTSCPNYHCYWHYRLLPICLCHLHPTSCWICCPKSHRPPRTSSLSSSHHHRPSPSLPSNFCPARSFHWNLHLQLLHHHRHHHLSKNFHRCHRRRHLHPSFHLGCHLCRHLLHLASPLSSMLGCHFS